MSTADGHISADDQALSQGSCAASAFIFSTERAARTSSQPSFANKRAAPAPMPELAPVMMTTLPERLELTVFISLFKILALCKSLY